MATIPLSQGLVAIVDAHDYGWLSQWKWTATKTSPQNRTFYAIRHVYHDNGYDRIYMHRQVMAAEDGEEVDHKNNDGLDNRRSNLRKASRSDNVHNTAKRRTKSPTSTRKGVTFQKGKWMARITKDNKTYYLGRFDSEESAAEAYSKKSVELYGSIQ